VSEWDSAFPAPAATMDTWKPVREKPEASVFITVDRRPDQEMRVRIDQPDNTSDLRIRLSDGVSPLQGRRALFESGAAVQQFGADYLISEDWLRRQVLHDGERRAEWERELDSLVAAATRRGRYVRGADAIRASVHATPQPPDDDDPDRPWHG
jgi:hypothetical protein